MNAATSTTDQTPASGDIPLLSRHLREATARVHEEAEHSTFMADLLGGRSGREAFVALTEQLWFVYSALEETVDARADHPLLAPLHDPRLRRRGALERDLRSLRGDAWRAGLAARSATGEYARRIRDCADEPARLVAHHYTRYLGDLSGGQVIPPLLARHYGLTDGVDFYRFDGIEKTKPYKDAYRAALDALPLDATGREVAAAEAVEAFRLNTAMFEELGRAA
ncbi:biliverdin-producing heme oxygenase [Agilicoccus flavus]|uniref:biliverdin-producing heme oxygenase n=1 Tax=Agilicoccus flavus TaxID=2775968 RepID=UPI001CF61EE5|nr:biliverdin-producing heme oxygenase [Agilicoccus flavus]